MEGQDMTICSQAAETSANNNNDSSAGSDGGASQLRANPLTVKWLLDNFEQVEGVSLPRSTIFAHYLRHCQECSIETMNPATFGKTIRSIFMGLRSRRLGTRGQSKYHYYGLSIKSQSPLRGASFVDAETPLRLRTAASNRNRHLPRSTSSLKIVTPLNVARTLRSHLPQHPQQVSSSPPSDQSDQHLSPETSQSKVEHLAERLLSRNQVRLPDLLINDVSWALLENEACSIAAEYPLSVVDLKMFRELYRKHCELVFDNVVSLKFPAIEHLWAVFWRSKFDEEMESLLSLPKFQQIVSCVLVQDMIISVDVDFCNSLIQALIPDVLRPLPGTLTQSIRNFAKSMDGWMRESMSKMPRRLTHHRLLVASALAQLLRRHTSLNHLAQAARTVLINPTQTDTMLSDISRLDISAIFEQGSLMCPSDCSAVKRFSDEFKVLLADPEASERWPVWIESVLDSVIGHYDKQSLLVKAQQFSQQWSYFSSLAIRDLTLRSAASFGSFHLIRLLFDEYVTYTVEQRTAQRSNMSLLRQFFEHLLRLYPFSDNQNTAPGRPAPSYLAQCSLSRSTSECSSAGELCL